MSTTITRPRVWLAVEIGVKPDPTDTPTVTDDQLRTWHPGPDGLYHTADGRHHATWRELRNRSDLVEVPR